MPSQRDEPAIAARDLRRTYRSRGVEVAAIDGLTFLVDPSEFVAITGPSGSGKTTLLNLLGGLDRPDAGEIVVLGRSLAGLSESELTALRRQAIGLVFQEPHLLPGLTALENVVAANLIDRPRRSLIADATACLAEVGLADRVDFPPSRLSAGQRQRVALARALVGHRPILLADEPTGSVDSRQTELLVELLRSLRQSHALTIVVATHDPAVAAAADRVLRLRDGRIDGERVLDDASPITPHELRD